MGESRNRRKPILRAGAVPGQWVLGTSTPAAPGAPATRPGQTAAATPKPGQRKLNEFGKPLRAGGPAGQWAAPVDDLEAKLPPRRFSARVPGALAYPFVRRGKWTLLGLGVFAGVLDLLATVHLLVLVLLAFFAGSYLCAYMLKVVSSSASNDDEPPDWPAFSSFVDDIVLPLFMTVGTVVICFLPAAACYLLPFINVQVPINAFWACLGAGLFYLPMSLLAVALFDSLLAINPPLVLRAIFKVFGSYLVVCIVLAGLGAVSVAYYLYHDKIQIPYVPPHVAPYVVSGVYGLIAWYLAMLEMRLIGQLYPPYERRLGWFVVGK
jgi:hypothetical protein